MFFSELYSAYYSAVAAILKEAVSGRIEDGRLKELAFEKAFGESMISIPDALKSQRWQLLFRDGSTPIENVPTMPLTDLERRWIKAVLLDPRIRLFGDFTGSFDDIEPLFLPSDIVIFDKYNDGDDFEDEEYIANFRLILDGIKNRYPLVIESLNRKGKPASWTILPERLEYSEKDDKFRLYGSDKHFDIIFNLGRILSCRKYEGAFDISNVKRSVKRTRSLSFTLKDERNALERVLLHFAHFEKTAEKIEEGLYTVNIKYDKADETEMVIRILSFGPLIKVIEPESFVNLIKKRLIDQKSCG